MTEMEKAVRACVLSYDPNEEISNQAVALTAKYFDLCGYVPVDLNPAQIASECYAQYYMLKLLLEEGWLEATKKYAEHAQ